MAPREYEKPGAQRTGQDVVHKRTWCNSVWGQIVQALRSAAGHYTYLEGSIMMSNPEGIKSSKLEKKMR